MMAFADKFNIEGLALCLTHSFCKATICSCLQKNYSEKKILAESFFNEEKF